MKDMGRADWRQVFQLFERWQTTPLAAREALVESIRSDSPQLYPQFAAMIQADAVAEEHGFMDENALSQLEPAPPAISRWTNVRLGPWVLREPIGFGGMGQVWLATRGDNLYAGRAAVKLMHAANATPDANARFAREGEFLARLAHPRIAQLHDAGLTEDGTRYLVLEHVPGEPLDQACDRQRLGVEARLQLFLQVCEAVAFAHLQRVVHRDLKPSNILVTPDGHVKLLDFGVAKIMSDAAGSIEATQLGSQWLTLEYAAPEQIENDTITTATDVYSLGVVLFRLLSGSKPHEGVHTLGEALRKLDQPPRSMLAALEQADAAAIAEQRSTTLAKLRSELRGDLATIVAKCLKEAPSERYDTAQALGDELRRYLAREPLRARPDSWAYRTRKLVQRNRIQALAAALVAVTLIVGISAATWQWRKALQETRRTRMVVGILTNVFTKLTPEETASAEVPVVELLSRGWQQAARDVQNDPDLKAEIARPLGLMLVSMGDVAVAADALAVSREHMQASGQTRSREYLQVVLNLGFAQARMGHTAEARQCFDAVLRTAAAMGEQTEDSLYARIQLGMIARQGGQLQQAQEYFQRAADDAKRLYGVEHGAHLQARHQLNLVASELGRFESEDHLSENSSAPANPEELQRMRYEAAMRAVVRGQYAAAATELQHIAPALEKLYGPENTDTVFGYLLLSVALFNSGNLAASDAAITKAFDRANRLPEKTTRHHVAIVMARQLLRSHRVEQAAPLISETLHYFEAMPDSKRFTERARLLQGELLLRRGQWAPGATVLARTRDNQLRTFEGYHVEMCSTLLLQAIAADAQLGPAAALPLYAKALEITLRFQPEQHPERLKAQLFLDYARWRKEESAGAHDALTNTLNAYKQMLAARADFASFDVLSNDLPRKAAPTAVHDNLFALLNY